MQHDDSEDEFGFWEPVGRRRAPRRAVDSPPAGSVGPHDAGDGEPTRQLQRIDPGHASLHTGELRRLRVSGSADANPERAARRFGRIPAASLPAARLGGAEPIDNRSADEDWYLDGDLTDEHYFAPATLGSGTSEVGAHDVPATVAVVTVGGGRRGSWRDRLTRDERGRFDPLVTRLGAIVLVGVLAIPFALATGSSSGTPNGSTAATRTANVALIDGAPSTTVAPAEQPSGEPVLAAPPASVGDAASNTAGSASVSAGATQTVGAAAGPVTPAPSAKSAATPDPPTSAPPAAASSSRTKAIAEDAIEVTSAGTDATPTSAVPACGPLYTIAAGDYWIGIAERADVTLAELLHSNAAAPTTALYPGRTICLPVGTAALPPAIRLAPTTTAPAATTPAATTPAATTPAATTPATQPTTTPATQPTTTTARTTPATQPTTTVATRKYSRAEVEQIIRDTWPDDQEDKAVAIATRESNLDPGVRNYCCYGLFQIYYTAHRSWLNQMGVTSAEQLFDPAVNALAALVLYNRSGGWGPWAL